MTSQPIASLRTHSGAARVSTGSFERAEQSGFGAVSANEIVSVGTVSFVLRSHVDGVGRYLSEDELLLRPDVRISNEDTVRGAFTLAGPPTHNLGDLFFGDMASAAGEIWRAVSHVGEPGSAMECNFADPHVTLVVEHGERELTVRVLGAAGVIPTTWSYDPFALIEGVTRACERLDRLLRLQGLGDASRSLARHFSRPAFPRCNFDVR